MILRRSNRIVAVMGRDRRLRTELLLEAVCAAGLARIRSDASKITSRCISDVDLDSAFVVLVNNFSFTESDYISQRLVRMAMAGIPVIVGVSSVPNQYLQFCQIVDRNI